MINTILGTKSNMTSVFKQAGYRIPVTRIMAEPNIVVGLKENRAILGFGKKKKSKRTENAYVKVAGFSPRFIREVKFPEVAESPQENSQENKKIQIGDKVTVSVFKVGDTVKVTGITKGRGFAGVVKRWGFAGGPKTHGQSDRHRAPGSIGAGTDPGRVFKGKKMAGHMGNTRLTVGGLEIVEVDENKNLLLVKGSVPGSKNGLLVVEKTGHKKIATNESAEIKHENTETKSVDSEPKEVK